MSIATASTPQARQALIALVDSTIARDLVLPWPGPSKALCLLPKRPLLHAKESLAAAFRHFVAARAAAARPTRGAVRVSAISQSFHGFRACSSAEFLVLVVLLGCSKIPS